MNIVSAAPPSHTQTRARATPDGDAAAMQPLGQSSPLGRDVFALTVLIGLVAVLTVVTWGTWGDLDSDTGFDVQAGARLADGQIPYRDFLYYYGPLAPFLTAVAASGWSRIRAGDRVSAS